MSTHVFTCSTGMNCEPRTASIMTLKHHASTHVAADIFYPCMNTHYVLMLNRVSEVSFAALQSFTNGLAQSAWSFHVHGVQAVLTPCILGERLGRCRHAVCFSLGCTEGLLQSNAVFRADWHLTSQSCVGRKTKFSRRPKRVEFPAVFRSLDSTANQPPSCNCPRHQCHKRSPACPACPARLATFARQAAAWLGTSES